MGEKKSVRETGIKSEEQKKRRGGRRCKVSSSLLQDGPGSGVRTSEGGGGFDVLEDEGWRVEEGEEQSRDDPR